MEIETQPENRGNIPSVSRVTPAPLRATVNILSEGYHPCRRCNSRIDGLAGYLHDADGRFIGVVHEKCIRPEELDADPEAENKTTPATPRLQKIEREQARWLGTQFYSPRNRCA